METEATQAVAGASTKVRDWVDYLQALVLPALACFGVYIAWQQHRTNRDRLRHELFDRRMAIYEMTVKFIEDWENDRLPEDHFGQDGKFDEVIVWSEIYEKFAEAKRQSKFLYGEEVFRIFEEILRLIEKTYLEEGLSEAVGGAGQRSHETLENALLLQGLFSEARDAMLPYLKLSLH